MCLHVTSHHRVLLFLGVLSIRFPCGYGIGTADGFCISLSYLSLDRQYCGEDVSLFCDRWSNIDAVGIISASLLLNLAQSLLLIVTKDNLQRTLRLTHATKLFSFLEDSNGESERSAIDVTAGAHSPTRGRGGTGISMTAQTDYERDHEVYASDIIRMPLMDSDVSVLASHSGSVAIDRG